MGRGHEEGDCPPILLLNRPGGARTASGHQGFLGEEATERRWPREARVIHRGRPDSGPWKASEPGHNGEGQASSPPTRRRKPDSVEGPYLEEPVTGLVGHGNRKMGPGPLGSAQGSIDLGPFILPENPEGNLAVEQVVHDGRPDVCGSSLEQAGADSAPGLSVLFDVFGVA